MNGPTRTAALLLGLAACSNPPPEDPEKEPTPRVEDDGPPIEVKAIYGPPPTEYLEPDVPEKPVGDEPIEKKKVEKKEAEADKAE